MKNNRLTLYAFLALSITVLPAACTLPDSGPTGTPAKPTAPKKEEPPEPLKEWKWSQLTAEQNRVITGLSVDPRASVLSVMARGPSVYGSDSVASIMIRRFSIPSNRNLFPLKFYAGRNRTPVPVGSENLEEKVEICHIFGRRSVCMSGNMFLNDVAFDGKGKVYILDSTGDELRLSRSLSGLTQATGD